MLWLARAATYTIPYADLHQQWVWSCRDGSTPLALTHTNGSKQSRPTIAWHANGGVGRAILATLVALPVPGMCNRTFLDLYRASQT